MTMMGMLSSIPHTPHSQPHNNSEMNMTAEFMLAIRPVIQVATKVPMTVAIASDAPATSTAIANDSNCVKAAIPVATAVTPGPRYGTMCSRPAATAQAPAFSRPIRLNAIQQSKATSRFVVRSINMYFRIDRLMSSRMVTDIFVFSSDQPIPRQEHQHVFLNRPVDVVEYGDGDLSFRQRRPCQLHQLPLERIAAEQQEEDQQNDRRGLRHDPD